MGTTRTSIRTQVYTGTFDGMEPHGLVEAFDDLVKWALGGGYRILTEITGEYIVATFEGRPWCMGFNIQDPADMHLVLAEAFKACVNDTGRDLNEISVEIDMAPGSEPTPDKMVVRLAFEEVTENERQLP
jgi:hypothetical protein